MSGHLLPQAPELWPLYPIFRDRVRGQEDDLGKTTTTVRRTGKRPVYGVCRYLTALQPTGQPATPHPQVLSSYPSPRNFLFPIGSPLPPLLPFPSPYSPSSVLKLHTHSLASRICCSLLGFPFPSWGIVEGGVTLPRGAGGENGIGQRFKADEILELRCGVLRVKMRQGYSWQRETCKQRSRGTETLGDIKCCLCG